MATTARRARALTYDVDLLSLIFGFTQFGGDAFDKTWNLGFEYETVRPKTGQGTKEAVRHTSNVLICRCWVSGLTQAAQRQLSLNSMSGVLIYTPIGLAKQITATKSMDWKI